MKIKFLNPCNNGNRIFQIGDVAFLPDAEAEILIKSGTAELVQSRTASPIRLSINLNQVEELRRD